VGTSYDTGSRKRIIMWVLLMTQVVERGELCGYLL